ncbi:MAG: hypothetical protein KDA64_12020 [Rhodospirillaceae bacterium]|nr:hypothetical protein [Rhodospirillaceae bacterium]
MSDDFLLNLPALIGVFAVVAVLGIRRQYASHGRIVWPQLTRQMALTMAFGLCAYGIAALIGLVLGWWGPDARPALEDRAVGLPSLGLMLAVIVCLVIGQHFADHGRIVWPRLAGVMAVALLAGLCVSLAVRALPSLLGW